MNADMRAPRLEHDSLGGMAIPAGAYYGIQTQRMLDNFRIYGIGINHYPNLISAFGMVKTNRSIPSLNHNQARMRILNPHRP